MIYRQHIEAIFEFAPQLLACDESHPDFEGNSEGVPWWGRTDETGYVGRIGLKHVEADHAA